MKADRAGQRILLAERSQVRALHGEPNFFALILLSAGPAKTAKFFVYEVPILRGS